MNKNQQIDKFELAVSNALRTGEETNRLAATLLRYAQVFDGVTGLDIDGMALSFPQFRDDSPGHIYFVMAETIDKLSDADLADRVLDDIDESIDDGELPSNANLFRVPNS